MFLTMTRLRWIGLTLAALLALGGCDPDPDDDDTAADDDDDSGHETGCITINGEVPGYADLQVAIDRAVAGDVISVCAGTHEGSIVISKPLSVLGEGSASTTLSGQINEMTLTIQDTDSVTVSGFGVQSTRNAIVVTGSTGVVLEDLLLDESGQYGMDVTASQVQLSGATFANHPFGGISASNSTLAVAGCSFSNIEGYGMRVIDSGATVTESTFSNITIPESTDDSDGTCIYAENALGEIVVEATEFSGCDRVAVLGMDSDLNVTDSTLTTSSNGIVGIGAGELGSSVANNNILEQVPLFGIWLVGQDSEVVGNSLTVDDPGDNTYGIALGNPDGTFTVTDNAVRGYGRMALWVQYPYDDPEPAGGTAVIERNVITDINLFGLLATDLDSVTFAYNDISSISWSGSLTGEGSYGDGFGVGLWDVDEVMMDHNVIDDVDVVGIFLQNASFTSTEDTYTNNHLWAGYVSGSAGTFTGLTLDSNDIYGIDARTSDVDYVDSVISNAMAAVPPDQWDEAEPYEYPGYGLVYQDAQGNIDNCQFIDNATYHLMATSSDMQVGGSTFSGDIQTAIYMSYGRGTVSGNLFQDAGDAVFQNSYDPALQIGTLSIEQNTFDNVGNGFYGYYLAGTTEFRSNTFLSTVDISGFGSDGYGVYAIDYAPDGAVVDIRDNEFSTLANSAVYADGLTITMSGDNTIDGVVGGQPAISLNTATGTIDGVTVINGTGQGIAVSSSTATIQNCSLSGSVDDNIYVIDSAIQILDNTAISESQSDGIRLEGTVTGDIVDNTIYNNAEYGISCGASTVTLTSCSNDMAGNIIDDLKEDNGCVLGCTIY